jgi:hypothetical protein
MASIYGLHSPPELVSCHFIFYNFTLKRAFVWFVFTFTMVLNICFTFFHFVQFYFYWNKKKICFNDLFIVNYPKVLSYLVNQISSSNPILRVGSIFYSFTWAFSHHRCTPKAPFWIAFLFNETVPRRCFPLVLFLFSVSKKWSLRKKNSDK